MRQYSAEHQKAPTRGKPFWMPWGLGNWAGMSFLFLLLLLAFMALFCLPDSLYWVFWVLLLLLLVYYLCHLFSRPGSPKPHSGDVQILLEWRTKDDLDLHVIDPFGEEIYYKHKQSASGGELDVDANAHSARLTSFPQENIYWPYGKAPRGKYQVLVCLFCLRGRLPIDYRVMVKYGDKKEVFKGKLTENAQRQLVFTFHL